MFYIAEVVTAAIGYRDHLRNIKKLCELPQAVRIQQNIVLICNNFLWMQYNKYAFGIIIYHLDPLINFVCRYIFLDNGASAFTDILLNNLSSSICRHILVS